MHRLPPPRRNPSHPSLPTPTTSTLTTAYFFHSQGQRAVHMHCRQRLPDNQTSPSAPWRNIAPSSFLSSLAPSGSLAQLHSYALPVDVVLLRGPRAAEPQTGWLKWCALDRKST